MSKLKKQQAKATKGEIRQQILAAVKEAFPGCTAEFGGSQGHRTPRVRLLGFRIRENNGKYRSNIVWVDPSYDGEINGAWIRSAVAAYNG